jgi:GH35 family endo-1,4-beta-xylanase
MLVIEPRFASIAWVRLACLVVALLALLVTPALARAQATEAQAAPPGGQVVLSGALAEKLVAASASGSMQVVDVTDLPGVTKAMRFSVEKVGQPWDVQTAIPITRDIAKGEVYLMSYWVRTISTRHESQQGSLTVKVEQVSSPHKGVAGGGISFTNEWTRMWARGAAADNLPAGSTSLKIFAGDAPQVIEIAGIEVWTYGVGYDLSKLPFTRMTYVGRELDAAWRAEAQGRIEAIRMAPISVLVIGRDGQPVPNATVEIEQTRNAFQFGIEFSTRKVVDQKDPYLKVQRETLPKLFNTLVLGDLKWQPRLGEWGPEFDPAFTPRALKWAKENELSVRGHVMVWPGTQKDWGNLPKFIRQMKDKNPDPAAIHRLVLSHIDEIAEGTNGYIDEWDVVNEPRDNHALIDLCGYPAMAEWFKRARARMPGVRLAVNDYSILSQRNDAKTHDIYEFYISKLLENGAPLDTIGMQGYFGMLVPTPERMLKTLDRFGKLGPMIRVTEFHIKGDDEDLKCDFLRDILTVLYSHPKVDGFNTWLGMQSYVNPDGSLTRLGKVFSDLVHGQWHTRATLKTTANGTVKLNGHLGRYRVRVKTPDGRGEEQWLTLRKDSPGLIVTVR